MNSILKFLNLLDYENNLSITNLAVYIALIKIMIIPGSSLEDAGMLFTVLVNYSYKKHLISNSKDNENSDKEEMLKKLSDLESKLEKHNSSINQLQLQNGMKIK